MPYFPISLGSSCLVAHQLKRCGLRRESLPFDWVVSSCLSSVIELIKSDSSGLLDKEHFGVVQTDAEEYVRNQRFGISFHHEFATSFADFDEVKLKFQRRIQTFRSVIRNHDVLFIRIVGEIDQMRELQNWCDFQGIQCRLLLLNEGAEFQKCFENGRISGYQLPLRDDRRGQRAWEGFDEVWDRIFGEFDLMKVERKFSHGSHGLH